LESESLITVRRGARGGATVHLPSREVAARYAGLLLQVTGTTLEDVYETRMIIEPAAARRLAERGTDDDHAELRRAWEREHALVDSPVEWTHAAVDFHETVVDLAGLKALSLVSGLLREIIDKHESTSVESSVRARRVIAQRFEQASRAHAKLVELITARKGAESEEFWRLHIDEAFKVVVGTYASRTVLDVLSKTP
jgi:DNA-binding FadR family transcriptional regulator